MAANVRRAASYSALTYLCLFGLGITVPLLLLLGALLLQSASVERDQLERHALQVLDAVVGSIDRDLDRDVTILQTLATSQALVREDWRSFYDQAKAGLQGRAYLVLVDTNGRQLVNTYVPYGEQPAMTGDPETVRRMSQTRAPVVSDLFVSLVVRKPVFNVSIPVLRDGQLRFVMSLGLLPEDLLALLAAQKLDPKWVTLIWDTNGAILARSRGNERYVGTTLPQNMREQGVKAIVRTTNLDGEDVLHATARSQVSGWGVGVNLPYSLIAGQIRNSLLLWGAAAVLAVALALALGWFFARQITASLAVASKAAAAFGHDRAFPITGSRLKEADAFLSTLKGAQQDLQDRAAALKSVEEQFRLAVEAAPNGMILADGEGRIVLINRQVEKQFGYARDELIGEKVEMLIPEPLRDRHSTDRKNYMAHPVTRSMGVGRDLSGRRKDGSAFPVEVGLSPISQNGKPGVLATVIDISERARAQERQQFLVRELQHRTQNLFAVVQSIVTRSLAEGLPVAQAKQTITGRLHALARAHSILADAAWEGAPLAEIIKREFVDVEASAYATVSGDIVVNDGAARQFALIFHELATNARKYGALSVPGGRVSIAGDVARTNGSATFSLSWSESGGPPVAKPTRKGFGSTILFDAAKHFGMDVGVKYDPDGLTYELRVPMQTIEPLPASLRSSREIAL
jgi:PAS domain S-box-containing protein